MGQVQCCTNRQTEASRGIWSVLRPYGGPPPLSAPEGGLVVATWNIAAINNNPFEYWITHDDKLYEELMFGVEKFFDCPGELDVPVHNVLSDEHFAELKACMQEEGWEGLDDVERFWQEDYRNRKIVSGFMKDKAIGSKRLASMPDRLTNTINVAGGGPPACRPTVINNYLESLSSLEEWWPKWLNFMFKEAIDVEAKGKVWSKRPCQMLGKISRAKYPAVTEEEEGISVPLQCLCQAIFDAVLVHVMIQLSPDGEWQKIKASIVDAIFSKKAANTLRILSSACAGSDIICLQEAASSFKESLEKELGEKYHILLPEDTDPKRNQNSMVLLSKAKFPPSFKEVTAEVVKELASGSSVERGDLLAVAVQDALGKEYIVASFHGDTNGLATKSVVSAVATVMERSKVQLVFCLDANTYLEKKEGWQDVADFLAHVDTLGLRTCFADGQDMADCRTCCAARTFMQPQLNKAIRSVDKLNSAAGSDVNPKDHILFRRTSYDVKACFKDNTGERHYRETDCIPTLNFPSDHGILSAVLVPNTNGNGQVHMAPAA